MEDFDYEGYEYSCHDLYDDDDMYDGTLIDKVSNGETSVNIIRKNNGDIVSSNGRFICNSDDEDMEDLIDDFKNSWRETHWNTNDWADWYGCKPNQVQDCMDDDIKDWY